MHNNNEDNQYISLKEASKLSDYSRDYLSLRARQGKLKAVKIGRNWVTTKEWFDEYINRVKAYKEKYNKENNHEENTDIGINEINNISTENSNNISNKRPVLSHAIIVVAILVFILFSGGVLGYYSDSIVKPLYPALNSAIVSMGLGMDKVVEDISGSQAFQYTSKSIKYTFEYVTGYIKYLPRSESGQYVIKNVEDVSEKIIIGMNIVSNEISKTKFAKYIKKVSEYVGEEAIVFINIISEKTLNNKLFANIEIPDYIKSSIGEDIKNFKGFTGEITNKIFYSVEKGYQSFILLWEGMLSSEIEISR